MIHKVEYSKYITKKKYNTITIWRKNQLHKVHTLKISKFRVYGNSEHLKAY